MSPDFFEFYLPEQRPARTPRYYRLLESADFVVPVNDLESWVASLKALKAASGLTVDDGAAFSATIAANYAKPPQLPFHRAVTAITKYALISKTTTPAQAIPLDVGSEDSDWIETVVRELQPVVDEARRQPLVGLVRLYWLLRAMTLYQGLIDRLLEDGSAELRDCVRVVLRTDANQEGVCPLARQMKGWLNGNPAHRTPIENRWRVHERLRNVVSGDARRLGWSGTWRVLALILAFALFTAGLSTALWSRAMKNEFRREHLDASIGRLSSE